MERSHVQRNLFLLQCFVRITILGHNSDAIDNLEATHFTGTPSIDHAPFHYRVISCRPRRAFPESGCRNYLILAYCVVPLDSLFTRKGRYHCT